MEVIIFKKLHHFQALSCFCFSVFSRSENFNCLLPCDLLAVLRFPLFPVVTWINPLIIMHLPQHWWSTSPAFCSHHHSMGHPARARHGSISDQTPKTPTEWEAACGKQVQVAPRPLSRATGSQGRWQKPAERLKTPPAMSPFSWFSTTKGTTNPIQTRAGLAMPGWGAWTQRCREERWGQLRRRDLLVTQVVQSGEEQA